MVHRELHPRGEGHRRSAGAPAWTHDVALVNDSDQLLAKRHITDDAAGYKLLLVLLAVYGDTKDTPIPVAIESSPQSPPTVLLAWWIVWW